MWETHYFVSPEKKPKELSSVCKDNMNKCQTRFIFPEWTHTEARQQKSREEKDASGNQNSDFVWAKEKHHGRSAY